MTQLEVKWPGVADDLYYALVESLRMHIRESEDTGDDETIDMVARRDRNSQSHANGNTTMLHTAFFSPRQLDQAHSRAISFAEKGGQK